MRRTHGVDHYDESCFGCRVLTVSIAPSAMPSRHPQAVEVNEREARWTEDIAAYKSLRKQGLQPNSVQGSAELTRATSAAQIEGRPEDSVVERVKDFVA